MSTHTPGPWAVFGKAGYAGHKVGDCTARSVAAFPATSKRCEDERNANAALIAAAPDLLDALHRLMSMAEAHATRKREPIAQAYIDADIAVARAAIAKAEGTS